MIKLLLSSDSEWCWTHKRWGEGRKFQQNLCLSVSYIFNKPIPCEVATYLPWRSSKPLLAAIPRGSTQGSLPGAQITDSVSTPIWKRQALDLNPATVSAASGTQDRTGQDREFQMKTLQPLLSCIVMYTGSTDVSSNQQYLWSGLKARGSKRCQWLSFLCEDAFELPLIWNQSLMFLCHRWVLCQVMLAQPGKTDKDSSLWHLSSRS